MLQEYKQRISDLTLIPSGGGCFELTADGELIWSKLKEGKFPDEQWVLLNWVCGSITFLGLVIQFLMDRGRSRRHKLGRPRPALLSFFGAKSYRKAG